MDFYTLKLKILTYGRIVLPMAFFLFTLITGS